MAISSLAHVATGSTTERPSVRGPGLDTAIFGADGTVATVPTTVSVADVREDLSSYTILDVRYRLLGPPAKADYDAGHLPGAHFVDLDRDLAGPSGDGGRHPLPDVEEFAAALRGFGVTVDRPVLCYDFADGTSAARAWWLLGYFGHPEVYVLDAATPPGGRPTGPW
jgi:3-mercaptopyruvate sulfurtransferase SseA